MEKILSVIIPTYNMEALLPRCLDSFIIEKKYMDMLEIIVVNDGSKDRSSEIGHEYQREYPNTFVVIDKQNGNYGSCINRGLMQASGTYIRICDADDTYSKKNLSEYIHYLKDCDSDIIISEYTTCSFDSSYMKSTSIPKDIVHIKYNLDSFSFDDHNVADSLVMHCLCVKRNLLIENNYKQLEGISYTDTQFVFSSLLYSKSVSFISLRIYNYYLGRDGQTMSAASLVKSYMHLFWNAEKMVDDFVKWKEYLSANKIGILMKPIFLELGTFYGTVFQYIDHPTEKLRLLDTIIKKSKKSINPCPIYDGMMKYNTYKLWKKYHIPIFLLRKMVHLLQ